MLPEGASACDFCLKTCTDFAKTFQQAFQTPGGHDHKKIYAAFSQAGGPPDQQCNSGQRSRMVKDGQSMSKYVKVKFQNVSKCFKDFQIVLEAEKNSDMGGRPSAACLELSMARCGLRNQTRFALSARENALY